MAENKTKATEISVEEFINNSDPKKIQDSFKLISIMERLSGEKAIIWGSSIVGFGKYQYKYASGHGGEMCKIGFSPRKDKFSLYVLSCNEEDEMALFAKLGKVKKAVSCIYFKKLDDLNLDVLEDLIKLSLEKTKKNWGS